MSRHSHLHLSPTRVLTTLAALLMASAAGCVRYEQPDGGSAVRMLPTPVASGAQAVQPPRAYMLATGALTVAHRQLGLRYAVLTPSFDGVVGPFNLLAPVPLSELLRQVADATNTRITQVNGVTVFEGRGSPTLSAAALDAAVAELASPGQSVAARSAPAGGEPVVAGPAAGGPSLQAVFDAGRAFQLRGLAPLSRLTDSADERVRTMAVRLLAETEGDLMLAEWPGRVSVFELIHDDLDTESLMWAMEQGGPTGGLVWASALKVLASSRHAVLTRHTWEYVFYKTPGTMQLAMWAVGRVNDDSAARAMRNRPEKTFTNWESDRWLAAISLARLDVGRMVTLSKSPVARVRQAAVFGAGFAPHDRTSAAGIVERGLKDADPTVRFLACQSAARLGGEEWVKRLSSIAMDRTLSDADRSAALVGLAQVNDPGARKTVAMACEGQTPAVRATAARMLGDIGGIAARDTLLGMTEDASAAVRAEVVCSLGRIGDNASVAKASAMLLATDATTDLRIAAMIGLGRGRSPAAAPALSKVALDPTLPARVREYGIRGLAELADRAGSATLRQIADLKSPVHDFEAVRHIELATPQQTADFVIPFLTAGDRSDVCAAANRLSTLAYGPGVRALLEGGDVFDNSERMQHMWGAERSASPSVTAMLIEAAASNRDSIRKASANSLQGEIDPRAIDALLGMCRDGNAAVRRLAAKSLGFNLDPAAVPVLIDLALNDASEAVYPAAIRALRCRDWAGRSDVKACFAKLAATGRDIGVIPPETPSVREQPDNTFVLRKWAANYDDLDVTNVTYESSLTYDSDRGRVIQWGAHGRRADSPQDGQTWFYDVAGNEWDRLIDTRQWPNGLCLTWGTTYDPANEVLVSPVSGHGGHGWVNYLRANMSNSIPWVMDARTDQWRRAAPPEGLDYGLNQVQGNFAPQYDTVVFHWGQIQTYDAYDNAWTKWREKNKRPAYGDSAGWDPVVGRLISLSPDKVGRMETWSFDPRTMLWTNLNAANAPPGLVSRLVYDSTNDVMIGFASRGGRSSLEPWVYHLRQNKWEQPPPPDPAPHFGSIDSAYDSRNNVVVFSGGWDSGFSGETTQRETWTYRYKAGTGSAVPAKLPGLQLATGKGGAVNLSWVAVKGAAFVRVLRGSGVHAWEADLTPLKTLAGDAAEFADNGLDVAKTWWYRVEALDAAGKVVAQSRLARTRPAAVAEVWAGYTAGGVQVNWLASASGDVAGYRVYRAEVDWKNPYNENYPAWDVGAKLKLVSGDKLVGSTSFLDTTAAAEGDGDEVTWPMLSSYVVKPVNLWGVEGGGSPAVAAIPDVPGPVRVIPWADGRRLVIWDPPRSEATVGFHLTRMDSWHPYSVYRYNGAPLSCMGFYDDEPFPTNDRRRYYVIGVDGHGVMGIPSSGEWSHGFP
ncbi:MAG: hypothetical protein BIFFINMI_02400 [Phycisphaerae bacterium]|nr:hypothetical protein [Phycisphaerae bacterium]